VTESTKCFAIGGVLGNPATPNDWTPRIIGQGDRVTYLRCHARRKAFTVIELLIVIGILAILVAVTAYAMTGLMSRQKVSATRVTLQNVRSMVAELEVVAKGLNRQPAQMWVSGAQTPLGTPIDIWRDANPTAAGNNPLLAPKNVRKEVALADSASNIQTQRYQSDAILNTQLVMGLLRSAPNNTKLFAQLPSNQLMSEPIPIATPRLLVNANGTANPPMVLDAWGNPIIFVPSAGLWNVVAGDVLRNAVATTLGGPDGPIQSRDVRPFFASAGPDGIFGWIDVNNNGTFEDGIDTAGGDDNVYSYEE
jgi:prepilin-type N-terminal cleavage/methylation domain-containing protein